MITLGLHPCGSGNDGPNNWTKAWLGNRKPCCLYRGPWRKEPWPVPPPGNTGGDQKGFLPVERKGVEPKAEGSSRAAPALLHVGCAPG